MLIKNIRPEIYQNTIKPRTIQKNESNIQTTSKGDISQIQIDNYKTQHHQDPILFEDHNGKINHLLIFLSESYIPYELIQRMYNDYEILFNKMKGTKFTFIIGPYDSKVKQDLENMAKKYNADVDIIQSPIGIDIWARDYFITLKNPDNTYTLFVGKRYHGLEWDPNRDKRGEILAKLIEKKYPEIKVVVNKKMAIEGGDVVSNTINAFVGYRAIETTAKLLTNPATASSELAINQAIEYMSKIMNKKVIPYGKDNPETPIKETPPTFHIDMGVMPINEKTILVGDIKLALKIIENLSEEEKEKLSKTLDENSKPFGSKNILAKLVNKNKKLMDVQASFDDVANNFEKMGYKVIRVPYLEGTPPSTPYITYTNGLLETFQDENGNTIKRVFMPSFAPQLDKYAEKIYKQEGFEVIKLPLAHLTTLAGGIRCNTQVLKRTQELEKVIT